MYMMFPNKISFRIIFVSIIIAFFSLSFNVVKAETLAGSVSSIYNFISKRIVAQIKNDFCKNYILAISNGEWKNGEFRTTLGKNVCTTYSIDNSNGKLTETKIQTINGNTALSATQTPSKIIVNNPKPDIFLLGLVNGGTDLDTNEIINQTNIERKNIDSNFVNLKNNNILATIAAIRVKDMFAKQYFEHNSPTGDNATKEAVANGYEYITIGENIALGNFEGSKGLVTAWMNSPAHRENILNKNYTEIGVSAVKGTYEGQTVWIAAQIFGKPLTGCNEPDVNLKNKVSNYKISAESLMKSIDNIDAQLKSGSILDAQTYNLKVAERNTYAGLYNNLATEIKTLVAQYNTQVSTFNSCIQLQ